jgi:dephospho-CoA kinase
MERPEVIHKILFGYPERLMDRANAYIKDITALGDYIFSLEEELKKAQAIKDAQKNFEALQKIHGIIQDTLGITGMPRA